MKKSAIILTLVALMLFVAMPVMAMGLAEDAKAAGIYLPGREPAAPAENLLENAAEYIKALYDKSSKSNPAPRTTADFEVYDQLAIKGEIFTIAWSTDTEYVKAVEKGDHVVLIDIDEGAPQETAYNLIAVVTSATGESVTLSMPKTLPQGSTDPAPEEIVLSAYLLADGEYLPKEVRLIGKVVAIPTVYSEQYGNITVNIQVGALADNIIQCYRLSGEGCADIKEGDVITVQGKIKNYKGTIEFEKPTLVGFGGIPDQSATLDAAFALADGEAMKGTQVLVGTIVAIPTVYSADYNNITVNIQPLGDERVVQCYRLAGGAELQEGDVITVVGTIKNYKGTIEFDKACRYLDGPSYGSVKTLFKAYELEEGKALEGARQITGTIVSIPSAYSPDYGNITVNLQVGPLEEYVIQCYRLTGGEDLQIGDVITVSGIIKDYKGTKEFDKGCTYTK